MSKDYFNEFLMEDWESIDKELAHDRWFQDRPTAEEIKQQDPGLSSTIEEQEAQQQMFSTDPVRPQESKKDRLQRVKDEYNARPYIGVGASMRDRRLKRMAVVAELQQDELEKRKEDLKERHPELDKDDLVKVAPNEEDFEKQVKIKKKIKQLTKSPDAAARPSSVSHDSTITHTKPEGFGYNVAAKRQAVKTAINNMDQYIERKNDQYVLPKLPYEYDALEPVIDKETMELHHKKHHKSYVDGLNEALEQLKEDDADVKALLAKVAFNGSGHILHSIFWNSLTPSGPKKPQGLLAEAIDRDFGSFDQFKKLFIEAASSVAGSGWALLVVEPYTRTLMVLQAEKHNDLTVQGTIPILGIDVWEHAYYLNYRNDRAKYVKAVINKLIDWDSVGARLEDVIAKDALDQE